MKSDDTMHVAFVNLLASNELYKQGLFSEHEYINNMNKILEKWRNKDEQITA